MSDSEDSQHQVEVPPLSWEDERLKDISDAIQGIKATATYACGGSLKIVDPDEKIQPDSGNAPSSQCSGIT